MVMGTIILHAARCSHWEPIGGSTFRVGAYQKNVRRARELAPGWYMSPQSGEKCKKTTGRVCLGGEAGLPGWETPAAGKAMAARSQRSAMTCDDVTGRALESKNCPAEVDAGMGRAQVNKVAPKRATRGVAEPQPRVVTGGHRKGIKAPSGGAERDARRGRAGSRRAGEGRIVREARKAPS